jgi:hypothetical protein
VPDPEIKGTTILQNHSTNNSLPHPRILESSATLLLRASGLRYILLSSPQNNVFQRIMTINSLQVFVTKLN